MELALDNVPPENIADAAAIDPYLRTLIDMHRDTMGVAIK
jgi:hypothetical protein